MCLEQHIAATFLHAVINVCVDTLMAQFALGSILHSDIGTGYILESV